MKTETEEKGELSYRCYTLLKVVYFVILGVALGLITAIIVEVTQAGPASAFGDPHWWIYFGTLVGLCAMLETIRNVRKWSKKTLKDCENLGIFEG